MAKAHGKVYLGYEDETISDKKQSVLNYTVNKIGGNPDWPQFDKVQFPSKCPLCGLNRFLIIQCYAPLENSTYHRTLYVFACINPKCWTLSESWTCFRSQIQANTSTGGDTYSTVAMPMTESNLTWCNDADEWDENDNSDRANGNVFNVDNAVNINIGMQRLSDEDEESNSLEIDPVEQAFGNLHVFDAHNANMSPVQGAVGAIGAPAAAAELEGGDEPGLVIVDTPTASANDIQAILNQTVELPPDIRSDLLMGPLQFVPKYIYVEEELKRSGVNYGDDKVTELLNKYRRENDIEMSMGDRASGGAGAEDEPYEETAPLHGDTMFHAFLTRLRCNPGQILRFASVEKLVAQLPQQPRADSDLMIQLLETAPTVALAFIKGLHSNLEIHHDQYRTSMMNDP